MRCSSQQDWSASNLVFRCCSICARAQGWLFDLRSRVGIAPGSISLRHGYSKQQPPVVYYPALYKPTKPARTIAKPLQAVRWKCKCYRYLLGKQPPNDEYPTGDIK